MNPHSNFLAFQHFPGAQKTNSSRLIAPVNVPLLLNGTSPRSGGVTNGTAPRRPSVPMASEVLLTKEAPTSDIRPPVLVTPDGFVFDAIWDMPGLGPQLQYTNRRGTGPDSGATFYVPAAATSEVITRRAREVAASFQEAA